MKKLILSTVSIIAIAITAQSQCDQTVQLSSSKTNMLNASYQVAGSRDENITVDLTKTTITITKNGEGNEVMTGKIKDIQCNWTVPFKEGKTVIKTDLVEASGDTNDATITIEGKDGKITLTAEAKEHPGQILQLEVNKFETKSNSK